MEIIDSLVESDSSSDEETFLSYMEPLKDSFLSDFREMIEAADVMSCSQSLQSMGEVLTPREGTKSEDRLDSDTLRQQNEQLKEYQEKVHALVEEVCTLWMLFL